MEEDDWEAYSTFCERVDGWFEKHNEEYLEFEKIEKPRSNCRDLHAMLLIEELSPHSKRTFMVSGAQHDVIYLDLEMEHMMDVLTEDLVIELIRCGVRSEDGHFMMYV